MARVMAAACQFLLESTRIRTQGIRHRITALVPCMPTQFILNTLNKAAYMLAQPVLCSPTVAVTPKPSWSSDEELGIQVLILATRSALPLVA